MSKKKKSITDMNGRELHKNDPVKCDGESGSVVGISPRGWINVKMDSDFAVIDWPSEQVEYDG